MHGINFGGWFSQCDNSQERYDTFLSKEDFKTVHEWGLDHVRIPVDYELVQNPDGSFKEDGFERLEQCITYCKEYGLNMILDLHKTIGYSFDDGEAEEGFFDNEKYQQYFYDLWAQFAGRFGKYELVAFELLNEVTAKEYCEKWNQIALKAISIIREYAPVSKILLGGYYNNSVSAVKDLPVVADENIVYNFHCYDPLIFTHQGAYWISRMDPAFRMPFEAPQSEYLKKAAEQIGWYYNEGIKDTDEKISRQYFADIFAEAIEVAKQRNVALYCGEYGVIDLADPHDSLKWLECIGSIFEEYGIGRALWTYKEMDFGLIGQHYDEVRSEYIRLL